MRIMKAAVLGDRLLPMIRYRVNSCRDHNLRCYFPPTGAEAKLDEMFASALQQVVCPHMPYSGLILYFKSNSCLISEAFLCSDCVKKITDQSLQVRQGCAEFDIQTTRPIEAFNFLGTVDIVRYLFFYRYVLIY